jgi:uncharacterized membrane protein YebE (DUF533 family)
MSLVKTLAKVAVGIAVAKGVNEVAKSRAGKGSILDGMKQSSATGGGPRGGLEGMLGQVLGGRRGGASGGLGGLLESLSHASGSQAGPSSGSSPRRGSLGDMLNQSFDSYGEPENPPSRNEEEHAALLLRAMIMAAKADGKIDPGEQKRLMDHLDDANAQELSYVEEQIRAPVDPRALAGETPADRKAQVYLMSIMAIDIDSNAEKQYLRDLAAALGLDGATVAAIHERLGVPAPA